MAGERPRLSRRRRRAVEAAVRRAEATTGLQFGVYLGPAKGDARARAEELFTSAGMHTRPAVLVLVAPDQRRVEVVTAPDVRRRVDDDACAVAVARMTARFAHGDLAGGIVAGVDHLAAVAGPGPATPGGDLPDVVDDPSN